MDTAQHQAPMTAIEARDALLDWAVEHKAATIVLTFPDADLVCQALEELGRRRLDLRAAGLAAYIRWSAGQESAT